MASSPARHRPVLERAVEIPAVVVVFAMMLHVTANALSRSLLDHPLEHTLEIVQYWYLPIIALLGFVAAQARGQHIAADLVYEKLPPVAQGPMLAVLYGVSALVCAAFARYSWPEALDARRLGQTAGVTDLPSWPVYFLVPLVFAILAVQLAVAAVAAVVRPESNRFVADVDDALVMDQVAADAREAR